MTRENIIEQIINEDTNDTMPSNNNELNNELEAVKAEAADYKDRWLRSVAEFANYRKRQEREWIDMRASAAADTIKQLLPVLDDFDRAFKATSADGQTHPWLDGFRLIERKFNQVLEQAGVTTIETIGKPFDPTMHESAAMEESDQPHGTILDEYRKGYKLNDKVLRPAMVKIAQ